MFFGDLHSSDFQKLAAVAGCPSFLISRTEDVVAVLKQAFATPGPVLVEVDMTAIGAFPPYAPYNGMGIYAKRAAE